MDDKSGVCDVVFLIEETASNGAYINDIKTSYIVPTLEYFSQSTVEERNLPGKNSSMYGIVLYKTSQSMPSNTVTTLGPFKTPQKVLNVLDKLELVGGRSEAHANLAEGLAVALQCFDDLKDYRTPHAKVQRYCILICNSPPYSLPVQESIQYDNKTVEQLATILHERKINLSIIAPRKLPFLYKLFAQAGGDVNTAQKSYCKDVRHLVLLQGFILKDMPTSPSDQMSACSGASSLTSIENQIYSAMASRQENNVITVTSSSSTSRELEFLFGPNIKFRPISGSRRAIDPFSAPTPQSSSNSAIELDSFLCTPSKSNTVSSSVSKCDLSSIPPDSESIQSSVSELDISSIPPDSESIPSSVTEYDIYSIPPQTDSLPSSLTEFDISSIPPPSESIPSSVTEYDIYSIPPQTDSLPSSLTEFDISSIPPPSESIPSSVTEYDIYSIPPQTDSLPSSLTEFDISSIPPQPESVLSSISKLNISQPSTSESKTVAEFDISSLAPESESIPCSDSEVDKIAAFLNAIPDFELSTPPMRVTGQHAQFQANTANSMQTNCNSNIAQVNRWLFPSQSKGPPMLGPTGSQQSNLQRQANSAWITQLSTPPNQAGVTGAIQHASPQQQQGGVSSGPNDNPGMRDREKIWFGVLEWIEKTKSSQTKVTPNTSSFMFVTANIKDSEPEIKAENWSSRLIMQIMPKQLVGNIGGQYLKDSKMVVFKPNSCDALDALSKVMNSGYAYCAYLNTPSP